MIIDIVFIILMVIAIFKGFRKGLIVAVFSLMAYIIGLAAAIKLSTVVAGYLTETISTHNQWLPILSFAIVFIVVVILVRIGATLIEKTFTVAMLGWANKLAGILFYSIIYILIYGVILFYAQQTQLLSKETINQSVTYAYVQPWGPKAIDGFGKMIPIFKNMFTDLQAFFEKLANK